MQSRFNKIYSGIRQCFLILPAAFLFTGCAKNDAFAELEDISVQMNKTCPMVIDSGTRLDSTAANETPLTLVYYYTATTANIDALPDNVEEVKVQLKQKAQDNLDTNPAMETFKKGNVALTYDYRDKNGRHLFNYTVSPKK